MSSQTIPKVLIKKGIKSVSDNMKPNEELNICVDHFMAFFGSALLEHYSQEPPLCEKITS